MAAPRKYPDELRERAIRMAVDLRRDPATRTGALRRVGEQLGINPETLRNWVQQAEIDEGHRPGVTTAEAQRVAELERENRPQPPTWTGRNKPHRKDRAWVRAWSPETPVEAFKEHLLLLQQAGVASTG